MSSRLVAALLGLAALTFSCGAPRCTADSQCGDGMACAPSGACFPRCSSGGQCSAGETCSSAGVCVSPTRGCAVTADCKAGFVCATGGTCMATTGAGGGAGSCGGEKFGHTPTEANVLIVLDRSCSMEERITPTETKWMSATGAVRQVTAQNISSLRFGLQMFSQYGQRCSPGQIDVWVGANNVGAISQALPARADGSMTPIGAALNVAANSGQLADPTRANFVLLVTDGIENCGGAPVNEVQGLFMRGVKTYTVGFGNAVDANRLNEMAVRGGTARATLPRYFQADSPTDLQAALRSITAGATTCDYRLAQTPPDPTKLHVAVDGQFFPRDPSRTAGWDYDAAGNRVILYGPACDVIAQRPGAKVSVIYGCPDDTLIEVGTGGRLDAGVGGWGPDAGLLLPIGGTGGGGGGGNGADAGIPEIN